MKKYTNKVFQFLRFKIHYLHDFYFYLKSLKFRNKNYKELVIVTGSDKNFFESLLQFIDSVIKHEQQALLVVYNLGMSKEQIQELIMIKKIKIQIFEFEFEKYPDFLKIRDEFNKLGSYAWKSAIIRECLIRYPNHYLIWNDSGNLLLSKLSRLKSVLNKYGFYSPISNGTIEEWTHIKTIRSFNLSNNDKIKKRFNLTGGLVGIDTSNAQSKEIIEQWFYYSMKEDFISPQGSSRENHRQDQSLLSIIVYKNFENIKNPRTKEFFRIAVNQNPGRNLYILDSADDNKVIFKKNFLKKYPFNTTNTISATKYVWILDTKDCKLINRRIINSKQFIVNISKENEFEVVRNIFSKNWKDITYVFEDQHLNNKIKNVNGLEKTILSKNFLNLSEIAEKIFEKIN